MSAFVVSKRHIDTLVQSALAGATDSRGWPRGDSRSERFRWLHGDLIHELDRYADVTEVQRRGFAEIETVSPSTLGQRLTDECVRSVGYRYPGDNVEAGELPGPCEAYYTLPYVFEPITRPGVMLIGARGLVVAIEALVSTAELAKGISCYEYQSCERPGWRESEAYAFCAALKDRLLDSLPGYEEAPWGWD